MFKEQEGRRVSIEEAHKLSLSGAFIHWRPEEGLEEKDQYAVAFENI